MAYTVAQLITQAEAGGAVKVVNVAGGLTDVNIEIGGRSITLSPQHSTKTVENGVNTPAEADLRELDLGTLFTANDVLESYSLKKAIEDGLVEAHVGTVALSSVPTV